MKGFVKLLPGSVVLPVFTALTILAWGCTSAAKPGASGNLGEDGSIRVVRDQTRGVTCYVYIYGEGALDCIPDSQLRGPSGP